MKYVTVILPTLQLLKSNTKTKIKIKSLYFDNSSTVKNNVDSERNLAAFWENSERVSLTLRFQSRTTHGDKLLRKMNSSSIVSRKVYASDLWLIIPHASFPINLHFLVNTLTLPPWKTYWPATFRI